MNRFIALPVGQGDAFYLELERSDFRVLVDGGKSRRAISSLVNSICRTKFLDVLVCTHNDADHAYGISGLLEEWDGTIKEVWLPGSWTLRIDDLLAKPWQFFHELDQNIVDICKKEISNITLENIIDIQEMSDNQSGKDQSIDIDKVIGNSKDWFGNLLPIYPGYIADISDYFFDWPVFLFPDDGRYNSSSLISLFWETIRAAINIRQIAKLAYNRGCKIRFFEFGQNIGGGEIGRLVPVYSGEMVAIYPRKINALSYLSLTVQNKQSLVFFSPEIDNEPAVLFSADSDLNFPLPDPKPCRIPIVTSPHHGSDDNKNAYSAVSRWLHDTDAIWIRSDMKSTKRPGDQYKDQRKRICTLCNTGGNPKQTVKLQSAFRGWQRTRGTQWCSCK